MGDARARSALLALALLTAALPAAAQTSPPSPAQTWPPPSPAYGAPPRVVFVAPTDEARTAGQRRSTGMMVTGIILTGFAVVNTSFAIAGIAIDSHCGEVCGIGTAIAFGFGTTAIVQLAVGLPLWIVGAGRPGPASEARSGLRLSPTGLGYAF